MSKKKEINSGDLVKLNNADNQKLVFDAKRVRMDSSLDVLVQEKHLLHCISLYKMFKQGTGYDKVVIVRSLNLQEIGLHWVMKKTKLDFIK